MQAKKCCYKIFSGAGKSSVSFKLKLKNDVIPYNKNPVFLGIIFDEYLCFNKHYENLRVRALKRFNIIKIFSYKSWHLNKHTLLNLYRSLIGSIFDYSSFTVSNCSKTSLMSLQTIQNRALRCIFKLPWDSPSDGLFDISGILPLKERFLQLGSRYLLKTFCYHNKLVGVLVSEYISSFSEITARKGLTTPLCLLLSLLAISFSCIVVIKMSIFCIFFLF